MGETGQVVDVMGDSIKVQMARTEACAKCGACTAGLSREEMLITARNLCGAKLGDRVIIELDGGSFLSAVAIMYGIPLLALIFGFLAGQLLARHAGFGEYELAGFGTGLLLMVISYALIARGEKRRPKHRYEPVAKEIADHA